MSAVTAEPDPHEDDNRRADELAEVPAIGAEASDEPGPGGRQPIGKVISDDASPSFFDVRFRLNPGRRSAPGRFVAIEAEAEDGRDVLLLARVEDLHEINPHEDAASSTLREVLPFGTSYAPEGASTVIYRVAEAEPLEEAVLDEDGEVVAIRAIATMPLAGSLVYEAGADLTVAALGLRGDPDEGLNMGVVYGSADVPVVPAKEVVQRHIFIGGGIGSGKSYTRGVLAEELHAWGVPQVNIDVNGEMRQATEELEGRNLTPGEEGFTLPLSALSPADVVDAVPSINRGTNMETLLRFSHETLLREVAMGDRKHFGVGELVERIDECALKLEMTVGSGEERRPDRRTVEPTKLRTRSLERLPFLGEPFDWPGELRPGAIINIDCTGMPLGELRLICASVARDLQQLARQRAIPFTTLSIDEFHLVAPSDDSAVTTQVLREIARVGRHYRLGLILTTQSPSDVDRSILKRLLTRFLHAIEPDQLDALKGIFSDASQDLIRTLPKLPQGVCVLTGAFETVRHATLLQVRERHTTHGGATPDVFGDLAAEGWPGKRVVGSRGEDA
ncbi:MAG TPA: ATP-binding protein [Solirubrobacterales bacterium]